jgi:small-conductance mechanosensitive channel
MAYRRSVFADEVMSALFREKLLGKLSKPKRSAGPRKGYPGLPSMGSEPSLSQLQDLEDHKSLPGLDYLASDDSSQNVSQSRFRYLEWFVRNKRLRTVGRASDFEYTWNEVSSRQDAEAMAARIFRNLNKGSVNIGFITIADFARHLGKPVSHPVVRKAFSQFHADGAGRLSQDSIMEEIVAIYKQRKWLANNLADVETITQLLSRILAVPFWVIVVIAWLVSFGYELFTVILPMSSLLIGLSFSFGSTARQMVESAVWVLSVRAANIGDRIKVNHGAETYVVKKIGLFSTTAISTKGEEVNLPNQMLYASIVSNMRRNPFASVWTALQIDVRTPPNKVDKLKAAICDYCALHSTIWEVPSIEVASIEEANKMVLQLYFRARTSWQATDVWIPAKSALMEFIAATLTKYDIRYYAPAIPIYLKDQKPEPLPMQTTQ